MASAPARGGGRAGGARRHVEAAGAPARRVASEDLHTATARHEQHQQRQQQHLQPHQQEDAQQEAEDEQRWPVGTGGQLVGAATAAGAAEMMAPVDDDGSVAMSRLLPLFATSVMLPTKAAAPYTPVRRYDDDDDDDDDDRHTIINPNRCLTA